MRQALWVCVTLVSAFVLAGALPAGASAAAADPHVASPQPKRHAARRARGPGFLPGYRTPEQIEWEDRVAAWRRGPAFWYGGPRFYRNRWNAGGFGPCWTQTPIGNVWNCGQ